MIDAKKVYEIFKKSWEDFETEYNKKIMLYKKKYQGVKHLFIWNEDDFVMHISKSSFYLE